MGVTIKEVAREAGVSIATVSRVLNDSGPVHDETRRRIEEVALRLRYTPHGAARSLITSKTHTLGVLLPDLYGEFFSEVIRGIDQTAQRHDYHVLISSSHSKRSEVEAVLKAMRGRVDGVIIMYPEIDTEVLRGSLPDHVPVVLMSCELEDGQVDSLNVDNYGGAYKLVQHLLEHGHRRIAIIRGAEKNYDAGERLRGYRAALHDAGVDSDPQLEVGGAFTEASGYEAAMRIAALVPRPTAVFASNDAMALGALSAFQEAGLRIPEDIAVGGFDDIQIAGYARPRLTSVHVPISDLGERAMDRLIEGVRDQNRHEPRREVIPATLVVRDSCGCHTG